MRVKISLLVLLAALGAAPAQARGPVVQPGWIMPEQQERDRRPLRPVRDVIDMLRSQYGGEYVTHWVEDGPRPIYVVRWRMPDGVTTREFRVDATR